TDSRAAGADAAELIYVDYEDLPVITDPREAVKDETLLFPDVGTNTCIKRPPEQSDEELFAGCEVVVEGTLVSQRLAASPLEPRASAASVDENGKLTAWLSTQTPHQDRDGLAVNLGMEPGDVRVVGPDVGGGFGAKGLSVEDILICWLARKTGRTIRWVESRSENMVAMNQGRAMVIDFKIGGGRDGTVKALRLSILADAGAYPGLGDYEGALDTALEAAGYKDLRAEQERRRSDGTLKQLGIGLSVYVEITNGLGESEFGAVHITADGEAVLRTGSFSHGQGHETTF